MLRTKDQVKSKKNILAAGSVLQCNVLSFELMSLTILTFRKKAADMLAGGIAQKGINAECYGEVL
jgi:hypothetical protein